MVPRDVLLSPAGVRDRQLPVVLGKQLEQRFAAQLEIGRVTINAVCEYRHGCRA
jgi:hypothetical protein